MTTNTRTRLKGEVWMQITDAGRKRLKTLMVVQDVSARWLAQQAGWKSHTILLRLLKGEQHTLTPDRAARIAAALGVGMDDLFVARVSNNEGRTVPSRTSARRAA